MDYMLFAATKLFFLLGSSFKQLPHARWVLESALNLIRADLGGIFQYSCFNAVAYS